MPKGKLKVGIWIDGRNLKFTIFENTFKEFNIKHAYGINKIFKTIIIANNEHIYGFVLDGGGVFLSKQKRTVVYEMPSHEYALEWKKLFIKGMMEISENEIQNTNLF